MLKRQKRRHGLQFVHDIAEHFAALALSYVGCLLRCRLKYGDASEHVHSIIVEHGSNGSHFRLVLVTLPVSKQRLVLVYRLQRLCGEHDNLIEIFPNVIQIGVGGSPCMFVHVFPESAVIPVAAAYGHDSLVGGQRVVVVYAAACALQAFAFLVCTDVVVQRSYGVDVQAVGRVVNILLRQLVFWCFVETTRQRERKCENRQCEESMFHSR